MERCWWNMCFVLVEDMEFGGGGEMREIRWLSTNIICLYEY